MKDSSRTKDQLIDELAVLRRKLSALEKPDIERKQSEEALQESDLRTLFNTIQHGVVYQNSMGKITSANKAAEKILGLTLTQMQGLTSMDPRWKTVHEDGSDFHGETHPSMVALRTGKPINGVIMGVFDVSKEDHRWITIDAYPLFRPNEKKPNEVFSVFTDITEHKQADEALLKSEEKWQSITENSPDHIMLLDQDLNLQFINYTVPDLATEEVIGAHISTYVPGKFWPDMKRCLEGVWKSGKPDKYEMIYEGKDGSLSTYFEGRVGPIYHNDKITSIIICASDITERRLAENEREKLLHDKGERVKELQCMYGVAESVRTRNTLEEILQDVANLIPPSWHYPDFTRGKVVFDGKEYVSEPFEETEWMQSSDIIINGAPRGSIEVYYLKEYPRLDEGPFMKEERTLINGMSKNISQIVEHKQAEEALQEKTREAQFLAEMLRSSSQPFAVGTPDGRLARVNAAYCSLTGYSEKELLGNVSWNETLTPLEWRESEGELLQKLLATGEPQHFEKEYICKDGKRINVELLMNRSLNANNNIEYVYGFITDITDRKRSEEKMESLNEALHKVVVAMSDLEETERKKFAETLHEGIGQHLVAIKLAIGGYMKTCKSETKEHLTDVFSLLDEAIRITRITTAKIYPSYLDDKQLNDALNWYIKMVMEPTEIELSCDIDTEADRLTDDEKKVVFRVIRECFQNTTKYARASKFEIRCKVDEGTLRLRVKDNGVGFHYDKISENIERGLGLVLMSEWAKSVNGHLDIKSQPGKGTEVLLEMPL